MKAVQHAYGSSDVLRLHDIDKPQLKADATTETRVALGASPREHEPKREPEQGGIAEC